MKKLSLTLLFALTSLALAENALSPETIQSALADIANDESYALLQEYAATVTGEDAKLFIDLLEQRKIWVINQGLPLLTLLAGAFAPVILTALVKRYLYYKLPNFSHISLYLFRGDALRAQIVRKEGYNLEIYRYIAASKTIDKLFYCVYPLWMLAGAWYIWISIVSDIQFERINTLLDMLHTKTV